MKKAVRREVGIAELKAHLSGYVRAAQNGKEIVIRDRETPIARLAPLESGKPQLRIIRAAQPIKGVDEMKSVRIAALKSRDIDDALAATREDRMGEWLNSIVSTSTRR